MAEIDLTVIGTLVERALVELRDLNARVNRIETLLGHIEQDMGALGRVMLRFESRLHEIEESQSQ